MDLREELLSIIPPLLPESHKGVSGSIGIVGGSKNYTGAPYYSAISALRVGADLSYVFCERDADQVIKSFSPELIVHPILDSPKFDEEILEHLPSVHSLVIGPGLGREKNTFDSVRKLINLGKKRSLPMVFDADALFYLNQSSKDILSYRYAILTPNKVEFKRLYEAVFETELKHGNRTDVEKLAKALGNVTIVRKGETDIISNGECTIVCEELGSPRRCGGQGDLLSGTMGVFNYWARETLKHGNDSRYPPTILAAMAACMLTRRCNLLAFVKFNRSMLTTDMIGEIHNAFSSFLSKAELI